MLLLFVSFYLFILRSKNNDVNWLIKAIFASVTILKHRHSINVYSLTKCVVYDYVDFYVSKDGINY